MSPMATHQSQFTVCIVNLMLSHRQIIQVQIIAKLLAEDVSNVTTNHSNNPTALTDCKMQIEVENKVTEEGHNFDDGSAEGNAKHQVSVAAPIKVASQVKRKKCVAEAARVHKVLEELSAKSATAEHVAAMRYKRQRISNDARVLLVEYARELSSAILEESCLLARHRSSKELIIADLKLIFGECCTIFQLR